MPTLALKWELSEAEYALLQRFVAVDAPQESIETYAARVGLKGLRGALEAKLAEARAHAIDGLTRAFDAADLATQAAALDALGFEFAPDGSVRPKEVRP